MSRLDPDPCTFAGSRRAAVHQKGLAIGLDVDVESVMVLLLSVDVHVLAGLCGAAAVPGGTTIGWCSRTCRGVPFEDPSDLARQRAHDHPPRELRTSHVISAVRVT